MTMVIDIDLCTLNSHRSIEKDAITASGAFATGARRPARRKSAKR